MTREKEIPYSCSYIPTLKINHRNLVQYWTRVEVGHRHRGTYSNFYGSLEDKITVERNTIWPTGQKFVDDSEYLFDSEIRAAEKKIPYSGEMTVGSRKRLKEACELMTEITEEYKYWDRKKKRTVRYKIGFLTVTLSSAQNTITDREIKQHLLQPFIRKLKKLGLRNYIWKAEKQQNGNIHFHIFVDAFLPITDVRNKWNKLQSKFSFIREFSEKWGHHDPNSTDIIPLEDISGATAYMLKYMLKPVVKVDEEGQNFEPGKGTDGKVWDCSLALKEKNDTGDFATDEEAELIDLEVQKGNLKELRTDYATIYIYVSPEKRRYLPASLMERYDKFIGRVREKTRAPD